MTQAEQAFTFEYKGRIETVRARGKVEAYGLANELFAPLPQGAWMDRADPKAFYWAEGNFFD